MSSLWQEHSHPDWIDHFLIDAGLAAAYKLLINARRLSFSRSFKPANDCGPPGPGRREPRSRPGSSWRGRRGGSWSGSGRPTVGPSASPGRWGQCTSAGIADPVVQAPHVVHQEIRERKEFDFVQRRDLVGTGPHGGEMAIGAADPQEYDFPKPRVARQGNAGAGVRGT